MKKRSFDVLGIGTAVIDELIFVPEDIFTFSHIKKGAAHTVTSSEYNRIRSHTLPPSIIVPGGSSANTIRGLAHLGVQSAFHSLIGHDELGTLFAKSLEKSRIASFIIKRENEKTTCITSVITPDKERTFFSVENSANQFSYSYLQKELFSMAELVHIEGYLLRSDKVVQTAFDFAKESKAMVSFDAGSYLLVEEHKQYLVQAIPKYVDILFLNEQELKSLWNIDSKTAFASFQPPCPIMVVFAGKNGAYILSEKERFHVKAHEVTLVDTTGAGDLFASGFLYGLLSQWNLKKAAELGSLLASKVIQQIGSILPDSDWQHIHATLNPQDPQKNKKITG